MRLETGKEEAGLLYFASASIFAMDLCYIVSGYILVGAIGKIRKTFTTNNQIGQVNIKMLWVHAGSFGLFLISIMIYTFASLTYIAFPTRKV